MKSMRQLINLMEGVTAVPGLGNGSEANMQTAGTVGRDQAYGEFDASQGKVTEKSKSEKQARFMAAAAHNPEFAKKAGISQSVAKEFNRADTGTKMLSKAMKEDAVEIDEGLPQPMDHRTAERLRKQVADKKWAQHREDDEKERQAQERSKTTESEMHRSAPVQQALADFKNMVENLFMDPDAAYDRIIQNLNSEYLPEFNDALEFEATGDFDPEAEMTVDHGSIDADTFSAPDSQRNGGWDYHGDEEFDESYDLNNGYGDINDASGNDYFPTGADSPVVKSTGPSGARQGDNPEQKKMQVSEVHKELVYNYRNYLSESKKKK